jgi:hypothetical protein
MSKPKYKKWSQADDAELTLMREARTSTKEIAKALKRTPTSVTNRIATLGIPKGRHISKETLDFLARERAREFGQMPESKIETVQGSQPKPSWWTRMMWWRKE